MEYTIYQLEFKTGVHFGTGMLNESACTFKADQLFSALYIEALKLNLQQQFYDAVKKGNLLISDAFPYIGQQYMIPKPMIYVEPVNRGESKQKKAYKKMKFIPVECLIDFLNGKMDLSMIRWNIMDIIFSRRWQLSAPGRRLCRTGLEHFIMERDVACISLPRIKAKMKNVLWKNC